MKQLYLKFISLHSQLRYLLGYLHCWESNVLLLFPRLYACVGSVVAMRRLMRKILLMFLERSKLAFGEDVALNPDYLRVTIGHWENAP